MSSYIDTHSHLYLPEFDKDRDTVVEAAVICGIRKIFLPNIDSSSIHPMNLLAEKFPGICYPMMGLHPTSVKENYEEELNTVVESLKTGRYFAIGETGIDLYWDKTFFHEQCVAFTRQLDLAVDYKLPVIIHARESFHEILEILEEYKGKGLKGIFHAFTGPVEIADKVTCMGFKLGIGGIVTYRKSVLPDVVREMGLENIVLETDSPYLTPVPFRGRRNESSYISYIAETISMILNTTPEEVGRVTTFNAVQLFQPDRHV